MTATAGRVHRQPATRRRHAAWADLQALRDAADKLEAVMSLTEDEVEASIRDFDGLRKVAAARRRAPNSMK